MPNDQKPQSRAVAVVQSAVPVLDTAQFEHMHRVATAIGHGSLLPKHLVVQNNPTATIANCFRVVNQAVRWGFDPFAIIDETYAVGQKLGYSGKLVAGVINAKAGLKKRLSYTYNDKTGDDLTITVHGTFADEDEPRTVTVRVGDVKTSNGMWTKDPRQKLIYTGATKWARAHAPEIILGIITDDDVERMKDMGELVETAGGVYVPRDQVPDRPQRVVAPPKATFNVVDIDGQVTTYDSGATAADEFTRILVRTGGSLGAEKLEGLWESNGELLGALRDAGLPSLADELHEAYKSLLEAIEHKKRVTTPKEEKKPEPEKQDKKEAPKQDAKPPKAEQKPKGTDWERVGQQSDEDIRRAISEDPDAAPEVTQPAKPNIPVAKWVPDPEDPAPPSPTLETGRWQPWMRWLDAQLKKIPYDQITDFLKRWESDVTYLKEKRAEVWQEFELLIDGRRVNG